MTSITLSVGVYNTHCKRLGVLGVAKLVNEHLVGVSVNTGSAVTDVDVRRFCGSFPDLSNQSFVLLAPACRNIK